MKRLFGGRWTPGQTVAVGLIFIVFLVSLIASQNALQLPDSITETGDRIKALYTATLAICLIVYVLVTGGIIWAIFRYKRRDASDMPQQIHGSSVLEFAWTAIPILILVGLFIPALVLVIDLKTPPSEDEADLVVEAVGHQWWWEFIYPGSGVRVQQTPPNYDEIAPLDAPALVVPAGQTVLIKVRSTDVVHSFYAPNMLYKIQAIPGNVNMFHFKIKAEDTGVYHGQCYQFCGLRHSDMLFVLDVREPADFASWQREEQARQGVTGTDNAVLITEGTKAE